MFRPVSRPELIAADRPPLADAGSSTTTIRTALGAQAEDLVAVARAQASPDYFNNGGCKVRVSIIDTFGTPQ
jgi:hypothetical protein